MTRRLVFQSLSLDTSSGQHTYEFTQPITVLSGPYGTGKSSLLELIKHALGGTATLTPAVQGNVRRVVLTAQVGDRTLILRRSTQGSMGHVDVVDPGSGVTERRLPVKPRTGQPTISSYLLDLLELPQTAIPSSRARSRGKATNITFNSVYTYLYLEQMEIDRSVVHHLDKVREPTRRAVFELLFGLSDAISFDLEVQIGKLNEQITQARAEAKTVRTFLEQSDAPEEDVLRQRRHQLSAESNAATVRLNGLRAQVADRSTLQDELRARLHDAAVLQTKAEAELEAATIAVNERRAVIAQLSVDLAKLDRATVAGRLLAPFEILSCPRCLQSLEQREVPHGHCTVCLQPDVLADGAPQPDEDSAARRRIEEQLRETQQLLEQDEQRVASAAQQVDRVRLTIVLLTRDLEARTRDVVSPLFDEIASESAASARFGAELAELDRLQAFWSQARSLDNRVGTLETRRNELVSELDAARATFTDRSERLEELSTLFDETVQLLNVPWYQSAKIDSVTYLPVVNDTKFEQLTASGGGIATVVNLAYHLTLLSYALSERDLLRPGLLVIDSPRKSLGRADNETIVAFYRRLETITNEYRDRVQVIVADNDPPPMGTRIKSSITFTYEEPMVPGVVHPGPENVRPIGHE